MASSIRVVADQRGRSAYVRLLIRHPMETGFRKDRKTGVKIPEHFVQSIVIKINGKTVINVDTGTAISKDPLFAIMVNGTKIGDKVTVIWTDNRGANGSANTIIK